MTDGFSSLCTRVEVEAEERRRLAPYACRSGDSRGRRHPDEPDAFRTAFQRDRDRIVHSTAFRRLQGKTQVFLSDTGDHYRDRSSHTLEVAQISRAVARALRANEDLTEALALAHDLGHPPFGHSGGEVLDELMAPFGGFEHNRQSHRIVDRLESRYPDFDGLNLSYEVRESILKHKRPYADPDYAEYHPEEGPCVEAQIVDLCDGIAYNAHDLEDGLLSGILSESELEDLAIWRSVRAEVVSRWSSLRGRLLYARIVTRMIDHFVNDLLATSLPRLHQVSDLAAVRASERPLLGFSPRRSAEDAELRLFLFEGFYTHQKVQRMRHRGSVILRGLFQALRGTPRLLPRSFRERADRDGLERTVVDYIAGMTDDFAQKEYAVLFQPGRGSVS